MNQSINQSTSLIMMVRPGSFRMNEQTAVNNLYQKPAEEGVDALELARAEFDVLVTVLREAGVEVAVFEDPPSANTPDALFPNNWVSFHHDGRVGLYPMFAENRRPERRESMLYDLRDEQALVLEEIVDFTEFEKHERYLEGTGSLVLDRVAGVAYAAISPRTDREAVAHFGEAFDMDVMAFTAFQHPQDDAPIYHTNVMMAIGTGWAVLCAACITDEAQRREVVESLEQSGHEIIHISTDQVGGFAGNVLEVRSTDGAVNIAMSSTAYGAFTANQRNSLSAYGRILQAPIPTIERLGGGSVRCMLAEVFLPKA
jgi:hypothetical protein